MGNVSLTTTCIGIKVVEGSRSKKVVTVLKQDGTVLEFTQQFRVAKLLRDYPGHFVCKSEELGSGGKARMLSSNTVLQRGEIYLVLSHDQNQNSSRKCGNRGSKINPLVPPAESGLTHQMLDPPRLDASSDSPKRCQRIRLVMTKQQLAKMIADGSMLMAASSSCRDEPNPLVLSTKAKRTCPLAGLSFSSMRLFNHPVATQKTCVRANRSWCPHLDSIVEVPSQ